MINKIKAIICNTVPIASNSGANIQWSTLNKAPRVMRIIPTIKTVIIYFNFM